MMQVLASSGSLLWAYRLDKIAVGLVQCDNHTVDADVCGPQLHDCTVL